MLYIDIETVDFFSDPHIKSLPRAQQLSAMRFGCAVTGLVLSPVTDHDIDWQEWGADDLPRLHYQLVTTRWPIVGWNIIGFDWPVIIASARRAGVTVLEIETETTNTIDLFAEIRRTTGRAGCQSRNIPTRLGD